MLAENLKIIKNAELDIEILGRKNEKLCEDNNAEIKKLEVVISTIEIDLEEDLKKSREDKLECKFDNYKGSVSWQKMPDKWTYKDELLMKFIMSLPAKFSSLFYKVTTTIKKADLKRQLMIDNEQIFEKGKITIKDSVLYLVNELKESHTVVGIEIEPQNPKFKYTIKKIK